MSQDDRPMSRIVVGLDGSEGAAAALRWAIAEAKATGAEIVAVHAFEWPFYFAYPFFDGSTVPVIDESVRETVEKAFAESWCAPLEGAGVSYRKEFVDGRAATMLLEIAEREHADLIVTGRRGLGALGEIVLGSVSHHLSHHAPCPVVLVPTPARPRPPQTH